MTLYVLQQKLQYTVKKVFNFPVPSRDVTNQTLHGREKFSRPGRVWSVTSRLGEGKIVKLFYSVLVVVTSPHSLIKSIDYNAWPFHLSLFVHPTNGSMPLPFQSFPSPPNGRIWELKRECRELLTPAFLWFIFLSGSIFRFFLLLATQGAPSLLYCTSSVHIMLYTYLILSPNYM